MSIIEILKGVVILGCLVLAVGIGEWISDNFPGYIADLLNLMLIFATILGVMAIGKTML